MTPRTYSNTAIETTIQASILAGTLSFAVGALTGYPAPPFAITVDPGGIAEEVMLVTGVVGSTVTVTRGYDGTTAKAHTMFAIVRHTAIADDFRGKQLGGRDFATTAPADQDAAVWDSNQSTWKPGPAGSGFFRSSAAGLPDSTTQLAADLASAVALGHRRLYLPAGTYTLSKTNGSILTLAADYCEIFGDGIGKTIIKYANSQVLSGHVQVFNLFGTRQSVHDMTILGGTGMTYNGFDSYAIVTSPGAFYPHLYNLDISLFEGGGTAGGGAMSLYQPWNQPNSNGGKQYALVENCYLHDMTAASAIVVNCSSNTIRRNIIARVGNVGTTQHGLYEQGGYNTIEDNTFISIGGFSIHGHKAVPNIDGSGSKYLNNTSLNPGWCHIIVDFLNSDGTNPEIPNGLPLTRYAEIMNNTCRNTGQHTSAGIIVTTSCSIIGNTLEDICPTDGGGWIDSNNSAQSSAIEGNVLRLTNPATVGVNYSLIRCASGLVKGNYMLCGDFMATALNLTGRVVAAGNHITIGAPSSFSGTVIAIAGDDVLLENNFLETGHVNVTALNIGTAVRVEVRNNHFRCTAGLAALFNIAFASNQEVLIEGNRFDSFYLRYSIGSDFSNVRFADNACSGWSEVGRPPQQTDLKCGLAIPRTQSAVAQTHARLVKLDGSGNTLQVTTGDTVFWGVSISDTGGASTQEMYFAIPGNIAYIETDGAWVAGEYGIISITSAGKIHNSGLTPPATGSYVMFLDAGGAAGVARCVLMRTQ